jgi:hypothetical protein
MSSDKNMMRVEQCVILSKPGDAAVIRDGYITGYAIIPLDVFKAMGGEDHPAYQAALRQAQAVSRPTARRRENP